MPLRRGRELGTERVALTGWWRLMSLLTSAQLLRLVVEAALLVILLYWVSLDSYLGSLSILFQLKRFSSMVCRKQLWGSHNVWWNMSDLAWRVCLGRLLDKLLDKLVSFRQPCLCSIIYWGMVLKQAWICTIWILLMLSLLLLNVVWVLNFFSQPTMSALARIWSEILEILVKRLSSCLIVPKGFYRGRSPWGLTL